MYVHVQGGNVDRRKKLPNHSCSNPPNLPALCSRSTSLQNAHISHKAEQPGKLHGAQILEAVPFLVFSNIKPTGLNQITIAVV